MSENTLQLSTQYPVEKFNILVPVQTVAEIADIQRPVMNVVHISTNLNDKEIYLQQEGKSAYTSRSNGKFYPEQPAQYALTRKGLLKLMRAAGIKIISSKAVLPSTCQKCAQVNRDIGKPVNCGACSNKDVKYTVVISAPQLTGQDLYYECSREIIVADEVAGMSENQRQQFMKFRAEHCESKALNRALRAAMLIKPTYTLDELKKPFVVAYLVPNLDNPEVRTRAIDGFFANASAVYGPDAAVQPRKIQVSDDDDSSLDYPDAIPGEITDAGYEDNSGNNDIHPGNNDVSAPDIVICADCNSAIIDNGNWKAENIVDFSVRAFGRPLCPTCQRAARTNKGGQR